MAFPAPIFFALFHRRAKRGITQSTIFFARSEARKGGEELSDHRVGVVGKFGFRARSQDPLARYLCTTQGIYAHPYLVDCRKMIFFSSTHKVCLGGCVFFHFYQQKEEKEKRLMFTLVDPIKQSSARVRKIFYMPFDSELKGEHDGAKFSTITHSNLP